MNFLTQLFLQPAMLLGTLLVSVPIIIYLLQRHRYHRRKWAAMEFLLRALKQHQRRIQLQNLILLLIRCLIIFLLALAMARPVARQGGLALGKVEAKNWIVAIDSSYSMGYTEDEQTLFDRARESTLQMIRVLVRPGDKLALMTFDAAPRVVLPPTEVTEEGFEAGVRREVEDLSLSARGLDLAASFALLDELCGEFVTPTGDPEPKRIVLLSDLQRKDWLDGDEPRYPSLSQFVEKIQKEGGEFLFSLLSSDPDRPNLAITRLTVNPPLLAKDVWVELSATVHNFSDVDLDNIDLTIQIDPEVGIVDSEPQLGDVIRVPAGGTVTRTLRYRFDQTGDHSVVAEIRSDGLLVDNRRYLTLRVSDSVKVLLVDGQPATDPLERETFHLELALSPEDDSLGAVRGRLTPFEPVTIVPEQLTDVDFGEYATVILANVGSFGTGELARLREYVARGGALIVFLGENVRSEVYHGAFHAGGSGPSDTGGEEEPPKENVTGGDEGRQEDLLPADLGAIRGDERYPVHLVRADPLHPVTRYFEEHQESTRLHRPLISFYKYFRMTPRVVESPRFRVLFRYSDLEKTPAIFDNGYGRGRVLWLNTTADQAWTDLSSWPDFVVFLYEAMSYLVGFGMENTNLEVGDVFRRVYDSDEYASEVSLLMPDRGAGLEGLGGSQVGKSMRRTGETRAGGSGDAGPGAGSAEGEGDGGVETFEIVHEDTFAPGLYRLDLRRPHSPHEDTVEYFCVNVDTEESALKRLSEEDLKGSFPDLKYAVLDVSEKVREITSEQSALRGREFWRFFIGAVLVLLAAESLLAWLFGRRSV